MYDVHSVSYRRIRGLSIGIREFWCRGYYVDTAGKDAKKIQEYIKNQLREDQLGEQLTMEESSPLKK